MIDLQKDITLVLGVDAKTIEQLELSAPTWKKNRAAMFGWSWIIFFDAANVPVQRVTDLTRKLGVPDGTRLVEWLRGRHYESQREFMLTGHVYVPAMLCETPWHMKLDTDALARPHDQWIDPQWFEPMNCGLFPVMIAPRWNYSKGKGWLGMLEDFGDKVMPESPSLGCRGWPNYSDDSLRVGHARMCSWCSYYSTEFTKVVAQLCAEGCGENKLPVPSQDTTAWYIAERLKMPWQVAGMKGRGWSNHPRLEELRRVAGEILSRYDGV